MYYAISSVYPVSTVCTFSPSQECSTKILMQIPKKTATLGIKQEKGYNSDRTRLSQRIPDKADYVVLDRERRQHGGDKDEDKDASQRVILKEVGHEERPRHGPGDSLLQVDERHCYLLLGRRTPPHSQRER